MKRLSVLAMGVLMAFFLSGCGESVEKKVESEASKAVEATQSTVDEAKRAIEPSTEEMKATSPEEQAAPETSTTEQEPAQ